MKKIPAPPTGLGIEGTSGVPDVVSTENFF